MSERNVLQVVASEVLDLLQPLVRVGRANDPLAAFDELVEVAGWYRTAPFDPVALATAVDQVAGAVSAIATDPVPDDLMEVVDLAMTVRDVVTSVRTIGATIADLGDVAAPDPAATAAFGEDLVHVLVAGWLARKGPVLGVLEVVGLVAHVPVTAADNGWMGREDGSAIRVVPAALSALLQDPVTIVYDAVAPGRLATAADAAQTAASLGAALGPLLGRGQTWRTDPTPFTTNPFEPERARRPLVSLRLPAGPGIGLSAAVALAFVGADETTTSGLPGPGVELSPKGEVALALPMGPAELAINITAGSDPGVAPIEITADGVAVPPTVPIHAEATLTLPLDAVLGVGRTGLTLGTVLAGVAVDIDGTDVEVVVTAAAIESSVGIDTADLGQAIASVLPLAIEVPFELGLEWSSVDGLRLYGAARLNVLLVPELSIGGGAFVLSDLTLDLVLPGEGEPPVVSAEITGGIAFDLGIFAAAVDGLGLGVQLDLDASAGTLGGADLDLVLVPPTMVAVVVNIPSVTGGGLLLIDHEIGRYAGAVALEIISVGIAAIVVIDTQLPGQDDGFALFASLTITFPGIPLGFGFSLTGVGGIVALNRALDAEALALGLRDGAVDMLLFPDDPIGDAAVLISQIDTYFPLVPGNTVIAPVIEISWGVPVLLTAQIGVAISMPDGVIAIMGSIAAALPDPELALLTLRMDVLGVIDIPAGEMWMVASLYDSTLLGTIDLSGDMAMYLSVGAQPYFLLSVGGFHPSFQPPSHLPAVMHDLRRMTASVSLAADIEFRVEVYFAVTSNTVQFGAALRLIASKKVLGKTYTAQGWFAFDVLLQFSPFKFVASMSAGIAIYSGSKELLGVSIEATVNGPDPWFATADGKFKFFGINVKFHVEVGAKASPESKPTVELLGDVVAALGTAEAWRELAPGGAFAAGVVYADLSEADDEVVWIRPDHLIEAAQGVAPLGKEMEVVGQALPASGHELLEVTAAGVGGTDLGGGWEPVTDWFAPAMFEDLGRAKKLSRASFELMDAGVSFGLDGATITSDPGTHAAVSRMESTVDVYEPDAGLADQVGRLSGNVASRRVATAAVTPQFVTAPTEWTVVDAISGAPVTAVADLGGLTQGAAQAVASATVASAGAPAVMLVPSVTAMEAI